MDRRDLLNGINDFLSDSIVLPPGDFDKELLLPIIETAKIKHIKAKRRSTRKQKQVKERINDNQAQTPAQSKYCAGQLLSHSLTLVVSISDTRLLGKDHRSAVSLVYVSSSLFFQHKSLLCLMTEQRRIPS